MFIPFFFSLMSFLSMSADNARDIHEILDSSVIGVIEYQDTRFHLSPNVMGEKMLSFDHDNGRVMLRVLPGLVVVSSTDLPEEQAGWFKPGDMEQAVEDFLRLVDSRR